MRELEVLFLPEAMQDLEDIYHYIAPEAGHRTAENYVRRIRDRCAAIGLAPSGGTPRNDLQPGLRTVGFERRALIAYRVLEDRVHITNVFYGGRDLDAIYHGRREDD